MRLHQLFKDEKTKRNPPPHRRASWPAGLKLVSTGKGLPMYLVDKDSDFSALFGITVADFIADDWELA